MKHYICRKDPLELLIPVGFKSMVRTLHIVVLLLVFAGLTAQSEIRFEEVYSMNPLSHNNVTCIHQDRLGFLWVGTFNGLNKYDGYSFRIYKFNDLGDESSGSNRITSIQEDKAGRLWIGTHDGKYQCFNPVTEKFLTFPGESDSPRQTRAHHYYESESGIVCLSTDRSGVYFATGERIEDRMVIHHLENRAGQADILTSNNVSFVVQDKHRYFWIGTDHGLNRIHEDELGKEEPRVLKYFTGTSFTRAEVLDDRIWFGNREHGLIWYDQANEMFESLNKQAGSGQTATPEVTAFQSHGKELWIGTSEGKLLRYSPDDDQISEFVLTLPEWGRVIQQIHCDIFDQVWLLTDRFGITRFDPSSGNFHFYRLTPESLMNLTDDERVKIYEDSRNRLWLGGQNIGIQLYDRLEDRFEVHLNDPGDPHSLQSSIVECIVEDRENNLWIGTSWFGSGLNRMITHDEAFQYIVPVPSPESKLQNVVRAIFVDSEGYTWVGTKHGQLFIYDQDYKLMHIIEEDPGSRFTGYNVYAVAEDREGHIWLSTKGAGIFISEQSIHGLSPRYDRLTFSHIHYQADNDNSLNNNNVYDLVIDELDRVWVATYGGGLNLMERDESGRWMFRSYTTSNSSITTDQIRDLHLDRNGRLWLATTFGINFVDIYKETRENLKIGHALSDPAEKKGLSYNDIIMIMEDKGGHLWLASAGGGVNEILNPSENEFKYAYYSMKDGLKDDYILSLAQDIYGFVWIGTASGLTRYLPLTREMENFDKKIGLPEVFFSERTAAVSPSGKLLFGTVNGFYSISPDRISKEDLHPSISLTGLQLNNTEMVPGEKNSPLDRSISHAKKITLKSDQSNFSIAFSLLSFKSPESNHYAYQLEGFSEDWNYIGTEHKATFTNIPHGNYIFRVKGLDSDLSDYGTETSLRVTILPPFWRTGLAFGIYSILVLAMIFLGYKITLRFIRLKNNLKVEKRVAESKLRFFTNISHELRTPLTLILGPIDRLISQVDIQPEVRHQLTVAHRNSKRLLRMVNQILDFRKIQHEKATLRIQEIELIPFLHQIYESFEAQANQKQISFSLLYDQSEEDLVVWGDIQKLDIVIFNLLSNAFKFTPEHKAISIIVTREFDPESCIKIRVSDSGIGIEKEKLDLIFNRFFVSHTGVESAYEGTGIGLSLSQEYIKLHNGEIMVESTPGKGTDFIVKLLAGKDHFPGDVVLKQREAYSYTPKVIAEEANPLPAEPSPGRPDDPGTKAHILVVEDDVEMCVYIRKILEPDYRVDIAKDGIDGWNKAQQLTPDLIVTDVMMPGMNGIELTEKLKDEFSTCHIPVIMLSSKSSVESQVEGLKIGAEAYVPKPFNTELLKSYIHSLLSQRKKIREILESKVELKPGEVKVTPKDKDFIEKVLELIDGHMADPEFNVEKLATMVFISRTLFYKKIKGITGYQPVELIRMMRLKKAAQFLETAEFTVSEVAYMVGYNDIRYFSTSFKKQYGISPSHYPVG